MYNLQIQLINEESEKLKERIYEYQQRLTHQVVTYNSELMDKKEQLEESCTKLHKLMRDSHITEQLQRKDYMSQEVETHLDVKLFAFIPLGVPVIVSRGR